SARSGEDRAKLEHEIVETSLRFKVLSRFTAYVAVDRAEVVNPGGEQKQVTQAVDQPAGWGGQPGAAAAAPEAGGALLRVASRVAGIVTGGGLPEIARALPSAPPAASPARARADAEALNRMHELGGPVRAGKKRKATSSAPPQPGEQASTA